MPNLIIGTLNFIWHLKFELWTLQAPLALFFFVADEGITDLDLDISFEDDTALIALADFIGVFFVALEILHFSGTNNLIIALDFDE